MAAKKAAYNSVPLTEKRHEDAPLYKPPSGFGVRHTQAFILFVCLTVGVSLRAHLSITMVAMTNDGDMRSHVAANSSNYTTENTMSLEMSESNATDGKGYGEPNRSAWSIYRIYKWNKVTQEMILYSFFVGYTGMMIPIGILAQRFGGKVTIMVALGTNAILSMITPWLPLIGGWIAMCACRLLQGMTQAAFYPSIHTLLGKWAPFRERGRLSTYIYTGSQFGTVLGFQLAGLFAGSPSLGWPATFWLAGAASLGAFCLLAWLGAATPQDHPTISADELTYIIGDGTANSSIKKARTPWRHILTSRPVWGLVVAHIGSALGYLLILTQIPLYMDKILGVDIKRNGVLSSLGYIAMYFMTLLFGVMSDFCANRKILSVVNIRRVANSIGSMVSGLFLLAFAYVSSTWAGVLLLVLCLGSHSGVHVGFHINQIDLAPNFAGPMMAMGNMLANLSGLLAPVLVANIVGDDVTNQAKWQILFIIVTSIMFITNIIFVILVKSTVQPWNFSCDTETSNEETSVEKRKDNGVTITKS